VYVKMDGLEIIVTLARVKALIVAIMAFVKLSLKLRQFVTVKWAGTEPFATEAAMVFV